MSEKQNVEWKAIWKDEYLQWICGFANAQGGTLYIGKDDDGNPIGLQNAKKLLEDLPNKIKDTMGIIADVNYYENEGADYIEIIVPEYPQGVSLKGVYYYRTGSTIQKLNGIALQEFFNRKNGVTWDASLIPNVTIDDLSEKAFKVFKKKAAKKQRIDASILEDENKVILQNLRLIQNDYLTQAAILLFAENPEKYITGAYIKIGFFESDSELRFQDEIHGSLIEQVDKTMEILRHKYMKAWISYDGVQRVETYPYPEAALREAIFNAVAHKQYISGIPIQISVYKDKIYIYNNGKLPEMWTLEKLFSKHPSQPYNPLIANTFFVAGYIESWGRGIDKICTACENAGLQKPTYEIDATGIMLQIKANVDWDGNEIKYDENGEKVAIAEKKVVIDNENVVIDIEKIRKVLIETNMNSHTKEKIIVLFTSFGYDKDFGRKEISELFEITNNSAGNLINKMNECNLLESHRGNGKGRYKFRKL